MYGSIHPSIRPSRGASARLRRRDGPARLGAQPAHDARLGIADHAAGGELHETLLVARQRRQVPQHRLGAKVGVLGGPLAEAVAQGDAAHAANDQARGPAQGEAVDRLARALPGLPDLRREAPRAARPHGVEVREPGATRELHKRCLAVRAGGPHCAQDLGHGAVANGDAVALDQLRDVAQLAGGEEGLRGAVDATAVAVVVRGHADLRRRGSGRHAACASRAASTAKVLVVRVRNDQAVAHVPVLCRRDLRRRELVEG
mmetsp:Transcript_105838/g.329976  ORF Transcript_105838/g.329976 Transcript_105838/m.329976 type:complete len:259 (+) Transcript_105838:99-875(+)